MKQPATIERDERGADSVQRMVSQPRRIQLSRKSGWKMPPNTVNVSRPTKWGNPYRIGTSPSMFARSVEVPDAATAVRLYEAWTRVPASRGKYPYIEAARRELAGKNLACWCPLYDKKGLRVPCHVDALLRLANDKSSEMARQRGVVYN